MSEDVTAATRAEKRDEKLLMLLDAARELAELHAAESRLRAVALETLEAAALAWGATECPICGRRGDHEWKELTYSERLSHEAEAARQG